MTDEWEDEEDNTQQLQKCNSLIMFDKDVVQRNPASLIPHSQVCLLAKQQDLLLKAVVDAASIAVDQQMKGSAIVLVTGVGAKSSFQHLLHQSQSPWKHGKLKQWYICTFLALYYSFTQLDQFWVEMLHEFTISVPHALHRVYRTG